MGACRAPRSRPAAARPGGRRPPRRPSPATERTACSAIASTSGSTPVTSLRGLGVGQRRLHVGEHAGDPDLAPDLLLQPLTTSPASRQGRVLRQPHVQRHREAVGLLQHRDVVGLDHPRDSQRGGRDAVVGALARRRRARRAPPPARGRARRSPPAPPDPSCRANARARRAATRRSPPRRSSRHRPRAPAPSAPRSPRHRSAARSTRPAVPGRRTVHQHVDVDPRQPRRADQHDHRHEDRRPPSRRPARRRRPGSRPTSTARLPTKSEAKCAALASNAALCSARPTLSDASPGRRRPAARTAIKANAYQVARPRSSRRCSRRTAASTAIQIARRRGSPPRPARPGAGPCRDRRDARYRRPLGDPHGVERARFVAIAIRTCSTAPAEALATIEVTPADPWRGRTSPSAPAPSHARTIAPRLRGSVTPSSTTTSGCAPESSSKASAYG